MADEQGAIPEARVVLTRIVVAHNRLRRSEITTQEFDEYALGLLAAQSGTEPFGYWVEQKHADPVLLRKPAYIPEPSKLREVTPLYTHPAATGSVREPIDTGEECPVCHAVFAIWPSANKLVCHCQTHPWFPAAPTPYAAASMEAAKIETYDMMHDIAVNDLGYPSILEALEAVPDAAAGDMDNAPKDGTIVRLLVDYSDGGAPLEDEHPLSWTIGFNNLGNTGEDRWQFAGWSWVHDHFCEGSGTPVGWLPWSNPSTGGDDQ